MKDEAAIEIFRTMKSLLGGPLSSEADAIKYIESALREVRLKERSGERYFFAQDESSHWYIIPERLRAEWYEWTQLDPDNEDSWSPPKGARRLDGGPQAVTFENPRGGGA